MLGQWCKTKCEHVSTLFAMSITPNLEEIPVEEGPRRNRRNRRSLQKQACKSRNYSSSKTQPTSDPLHWSVYGATSES